MISVLIALGRGALVSSVLPSYRGHRYPVEVISHCVWLYIRFPLSYREAEELMLHSAASSSPTRRCGGGV